MSKALPIIGVVVVIGIVGLGYMFGGGDGQAARDRALDASLIGTDGLQIVLRDHSIDYTHSQRRLAPLASDFSLGLIPLYDINLNEDITPAKTPEEEMLQASQRDLYFWTLSEKLYALPSLVILPKWRTGFNTSGVAHDSTLIPLPGVANLSRDLGLPQAIIARDGPRFATARAGMKGQSLRDLALFQAQVFRRDLIPVTCSEVLGIAAGALVISCEESDYFAAKHFLSDPDLLNNHGLGLAENALAAADLIATLRSDATKPVYIDTSSDLQLRTEDTVDEAEDYSRGWEEFARFFEYPLSVLWMIGAVVLGLAGWRGAFRFGPPRLPLDDRLEQSKTVGIEAKARLLRLSGNDGRMVGEFVRARLDALAETSFGAGVSAGHDRLFKLLARRDAALAAQFQTLCAQLMARGHTLPQPELYQQLATFRDLLERLTHGPDPISKPD